MNFYDFEATLMNGEKISMSKYQGKVVLVVNTASKCALAPQFKTLEELYQQYESEGFVILGFPSDQFAGQELQKNKDIQEYCKLNYGVTFPVFQKIKVNGSQAHPLWQFLKKEQKGLMGSAIKWNFTKFLVNRQGDVMARYAPQIAPKAFEAEIKAALNQSK